MEVPAQQLALHRARAARDRRGLLLAEHCLLHLLRPGVLGRQRRLEHDLSEVGRVRCALVPAAVARHFHVAGESIEGKLETDLRGLEVTYQYGFDR